VIFGHFGDRIGRKKLLMLSLIIMGAATAAIGLLPTYNTLGIWAPMLLVALRLVQGFAVGGEWGGAVLLVAEHGSARHRGFWTSWPQVGVPAGNLLAAAVLALTSALLSPEDFLAWGWRIPFLLSTVLVLLGWWLRSNLSESQTFAEAKAEGPKRFPVLEVIRRRPRNLLIGGGLRLGENIAYYVITAFSITYFVEVLGGSRALALNALLVGAAAECVTLPLFAALSDRVGRRPVYALAAIGMTVWIFAFFALLNTGSAGFVVLAMVGGLVLHGAMYGPQAAFMAEMFPTSVRYSGVSLAYQVTSILAGSLAPIIALGLYSQTKSFVPVAIYVALTCAVSAGAALLARETRGISLADND
jgi:MFS family permease